MCRQIIGNFRGIEPLNCRAIHPHPASLRVGTLAHSLKDKNTGNLRSPKNGR